MGSRGKLEIDLQTTSAKAGPMLDQIFFGGRTDNQSNWEGRLDEIAVFNRVLTDAEVQKLAK